MSTTPTEALPAARRGVRAPALPPDERRQAILDAVIPLLVERGAAVTTRQLAEAAGVAEGTLFRVFADKTALLHAAAHAVLDPARTRRALADVDPDLSLDDMVRMVADLLLDSTARVMSVLMALRSTGAEGDRPGPPPSSPPGPPPFLREAHAAVHAGLTELFERYRSQLRVEPDRAALVLRALVSGSRPPWADDASRLTGQEIASTLVGGVRAGPGRGAPC